MAYAVRIAGPETPAVFDLKGPQDALAAWLAGAGLPGWPSRPGTRCGAGRWLAWTGASHWLLVAPLADEAVLEAALRGDAAPETVRIVTVSDALAFFSIEGPDAASVMAVASPLDLHAAAFPGDGATFTEVFGLRALVTRQGDGFLLAVDRSYGPFVAEYLARLAG
jgi:heterotetrameric sarcosine oxidase gamma subunit